MDMSETNPSEQKLDKHTAVRLEIKQAAFKLLESGGFENLSMHKIAKEMKTTTPALYYYFKNRNALLAALSEDVIENLEDHLRQSHAAHEHEATIRQAFAILSGFYNWGRENPLKYQLLFANPIPDYAPSETLYAHILRSMSVFLEVCQEAVKMNILSPQPLALTPEMKDELEGYGEKVGVQLPPEILFLTITGWARLHGLITLELNGYLTTVISNLDRTYFLEARQLLEEIGFTYQRTG